MAATASNNKRIALVLGSGGIVGGAYHAGALKALHDTWGIDGREVDLIVGTSAGAIAGAFVAAGLHPNDLFRRETAKDLSPAGKKILDKARAKRGPKVTATSAVGVPAAPEALFKAMLNPAGVSVGGLGAAMLPRGKVQTGHVAGMAEGLLGSTWPTKPELRICAVELATARRVIFGGRPEATQVAKPSEAIAASCAVPAVFEPVKIDGTDYVDGGVHSANNLDVIEPDCYDLVIVSSPMTGHGGFDAGQTWMALRDMARWQSRRERSHLSARTKVEIIQPTSADLDAMGSNLLDPSRRPAVAFQAHASVCAQLSQKPNPIAA